MEDDVDVWRYAILELHARNDDDKVIETGTIRKLGCGYLFAFDSNYSLQKEMTTYRH